MTTALRISPLFLALLLTPATTRLLADPAVDARSLATSVTIQRDEWGVPHIYGPTDASTSFGLAYAQAEDYFWQIEDTYLQALGRYAEVVGPSGLSSDVLIRITKSPRGPKRISSSSIPRSRPSAQRTLLDSTTFSKSTRR